MINILTSSGNADNISANNVFEMSMIVWRYFTKTDCITISRNSCDIFITNYAFCNQVIVTNCKKLYFFK